jgi:predicted SnoaL-like aldol condensation-catalyzing enzyme
MKVLKTLAILLIIAFLFTGCNNDDDNNLPNYVDLTQENANSLLAKSALQAFDNQDKTQIPIIYHTNFIQHRPSISDGLAGLEAAYDLSISQNEIITRETIRVAAQGDLVAIQGRVSVDVLGGRPAIVYDIFRIQDGQIIEHWGVEQSEPNPAVSPANGNTMVDGGGDLNKLMIQVELDRNTQTVTEFIHRGFAQGDKAHLETLFGDEYIQHNPNIPNGADVILGFITQGQGFPAEIKRTVAMGDLVFALIHYSDATGSTNGNGVVDVFRLDDNGKVVEHWDASQAIPADQDFAHNNGFF